MHNFINRLIGRRMEHKDSLLTFVNRSHHGDVTDQRLHAHRIEDFVVAKPSPHQRRDFHKVSLLTRADGILHYADRSMHVKDNALIFSNPLIPYSWERLSGSEAGFFCLFREGFISNHFKAGSLALSPLFKVGGTPVLYPDEFKTTFFKSLFEQILHEVDSTYTNKTALLQDYLQILIHESLKLPVTDEAVSRHHTYSRVSPSFLELLEIQFPVASKDNPIQLKTVAEFADQLSVHPNHLNKAVKQSTGKTAITHIQERIMTEARTLLIHTTWEIADIGYALGFLHPSNFITFFKKRSGFTPHQFRKRAVVN